MVKVTDNEIIIEDENNCIHINEYNYQDVLLNHTMDVKENDVRSFVANEVFRKFTKYRKDDYLQKNANKKSIEFNTIENKFSLTYQDVEIEINEKVKNNILLKSKQLDFTFTDSAISEDLLLSCELSISKLLNLFEFEELKYYEALFMYTELDDTYQISQVNYTIRSITGIVLLLISLPLLFFNSLYFVFNLLIIYKYIELNSEHVLRVYRSLIIYYKFNPFGKTLFKNQLTFIFIQGMILYMYLFISIVLFCLGFVENNIYNTIGLVIFGLLSLRYYKFFTEFLPLFIKVKLRK